MEVDTGAAVSIIDEETYRRYFKYKALTKTEIRLNSYTSEIKVLGSMEVNVQYNGQQDKLLLIVVKGSGPPLVEETGCT